MGYTSDNIWLDAIWLQRLAATSPQGFEQLMNFRIPDRPGDGLVVFAVNVVLNEVRKHTSVVMVKW